MMKLDIEHIKQCGYNDANDACNESGCGDEPSGGWDSWTIDAAGIEDAADWWIPGWRGYVPEEYADDPAEWLEDDGSEVWEQACEAYCEGARDAAKNYESARQEALIDADEAGWRICVFGRPGSSSFRCKVSAPGEADAVSQAIYKPGPQGPYESEILKPSEAARVTWQDGSAVYADEIAAIIEEIA